MPHPPASTSFVLEWQACVTKPSLVLMTALEVSLSSSRFSDNDRVIPPHDSFSFEDAVPGNSLHSGVLGLPEIA